MAAPPQWLSCFCETWGPGIVYSPSGPWISEELLDRLLAGDSASSSNSTRPTEASSSSLSPGAPGAPGAASVAAAPSSTSSAPSSSSSTSAPFARARDVVSSRRARPFTGDYGAHPFAARCDMLRCALQRVPDEAIPTMLPDNVTGRSRGMAWYCLQPSINFDPFPGLADWLSSCHYEAFRSRGLEVNDLIGLLTVGGDPGVVGLARPTDKSHPLVKDPHAVGGFYTDSHARGTLLGFYPGLLCGLDEVDKWMKGLPQFLPTTQQQLEGDGADGRTAHGASLPLANLTLPGGGLLSSSPAYPLPLRGSVAGAAVADLALPQTAAAASGVVSPSSALDAPAAAPAAAPPAASSAVPASPEQQLAVDCSSACEQQPQQSATDPAEAAASSVLARGLGLGSPWGPLPHSTGTGGSSSNSSAGSTLSSSSANDMLCRAKLWTYDYAAPQIANVPTLTYQGAFIRNVLCSVNDYHKIGDAPNVTKVPVILGGVIPLVMFVTSRPVRQYEEALLEYGPDWYSVYCKYNPALLDVFFGTRANAGSMSDLLMSFGLKMKQRTRSARKGADQDTLMATAISRVREMQQNGGAGERSPPRKIRGMGGRGRGRGRGASAAASSSSRAATAAEEATATAAPAAASAVAAVVDEEAAPDAPVAAAPATVAGPAGIARGSSGALATATGGSPRRRMGAAVGSLLLQEPESLLGQDEAPGVSGRGRAPPPALSGASSASSSASSSAAVAAAAHNGADAGESVTPRALSSGRLVVAIAAAAAVAVDSSSADTPTAATAAGDAATEAAFLSGTASLLPAEADRTDAPPGPGSPPPGPGSLPADASPTGSLPTDAASSSSSSLSAAVAVFTHAKPLAPSPTSSSVSSFGGGGRSAAAAAAMAAPLLQGQLCGGGLNVEACPNYPEATGNVQHLLLRLWRQAAVSAAVAAAAAAAARRRKTPTHGHRAAAAAASDGLSVTDGCGSSVTGGEDGEAEARGRPPRPKHAPAPPAVKPSWEYVADDHFVQRHTAHFGITNEMRLCDVLATLESGRPRRGSRGTGTTPSSAAGAGGPPPGSFASSPSSASASAAAAAAPVGDSSPSPSSWGGPSSSSGAAPGSGAQQLAPWSGAPQLARPKSASHKRGASSSLRGGRRVGAVPVAGAHPPPTSPSTPSAVAEDEEDGAAAGAAGGPGSPLSSEGGSAPAPVRSGGVGEIGSSSARPPAASPSHGPGGASAAAVVSLKKKRGRPPSKKPLDSPTSRPVLDLLLDPSALAAAAAIAGGAGPASSPSSGAIGLRAAPLSMGGAGAAAGSWTYVNVDVLATRVTERVGINSETRLSDVLAALESGRPKRQRTGGSASSSAVTPSAGLLGAGFVPAPGPGALGAGGSGPPVVAASAGSSSSSGGSSSSVAGGSAKQKRGGGVWRSYVEPPPALLHPVATGEPALLPPAAAGKHAAASLAPAAREAEEEVAAATAALN